MYQQGNSLQEAWDKLLKEREDEHEVFRRIRKFGLAAWQDDVLGQMHPYTSLDHLVFSTASEPLLYVTPLPSICEYNALAMIREPSKELTPELRVEILQTILNQHSRFIGQLAPHVLIDENQRIICVTDIAIAVEHFFELTDGQYNVLKIYRDTAARKGNLIGSGNVEKVVNIASEYVFREHGAAFPADNPGESSQAENEVFYEGAKLIRSNDDKR